MKTPIADKIINANLNRLFMKRMMENKGWSREQARSYLVEFVNCGKKISLRDFMEAK